MPLTPTTQLGPYEILEPIGAGGMGEVYRARDPRLQRIVAIKILPGAYASDPERLRRFEQEARAAAAITHPNILAVYDVGTHRRVNAEGPGEATPYVVTELLEGRTLDDRLRQGPVPVSKAIELMLQILRGLAATHGRGIVHRDLKPANIFITNDGAVKILDFGIAKLTRDEPGEGAGSPTMLATRAGVVLGTVGYMSPEQACGNPADARSDLFAVGAILYEMLAGERAFEGTTDVDTTAAILSRDPPELPAAERQIPEALVHIVQHCLEKTPGARFQTATDLAFALESLSFTSDSVPAVVGNEQSSSWWRAAAAAVLVVAALGVAGFWYVRAPTNELAYHSTIATPAGVGAFASAPPLALSPDGRHLVFAATRFDGNSQLWIRELDRPNAQPLSGTDGAEAPFWSPDSRYVAFIANDSLKRIAIAGGPAVTLGPAAVGFQSTGAWNDEDEILFTGVGGTLHRVPAGGGAAAALTLADVSPGEVLSYPFFLPDGRHFLYLAQLEGRPSVLYVGSLDEPGRTRLLEGISNAQYADNMLTFVRESTLMAQPFDPNRLRLSGEAVPLADQIQLSSLTYTAGTLRAGAFSVSDAGALVYLKAAADSQLVWYDRSGSRIGVLGEPAAYGDVFISRDGSLVSVSIETAGTGTRDIWTFDLKRGFKTRETFDPGNEFDGVWSPDGSRMAFNSSRNGVMDLYQKAAGTGVEETLLVGDLAKFPQSWSPDGNLLLYLTQDASQNQDIWVLPLEGAREPYPFLDTPFSEGVGARFSPDGRWISYVSNESGRQEVYLKAFPDSGNRWTVSRNGGLITEWRGDGRELYFMEPSTNRLMAVALSYDTSGGVSVGEAQPITTVRPAGPRAFFSAMPDGQRFLVNSVLDEAGEVPITLVVNWPALVSSN